MKELPEIPQSYLISLLAICLVVMRAFGIDSWTTAALSSITGYILGKHIEQTRKPQIIATDGKCKDAIKKEGVEVEF